MEGLENVGEVYPQERYVYLYIIYLSSIYPFLS